MNVGHRLAEIRAIAETIAEQAVLSDDLDLRSLEGQTYHLLDCISSLLKAQEQ